MFSDGVNWLVSGGCDLKPYGLVARSCRGTRRLSGARPTALYHRIQLMLRDQILAGHYAKARLPSEQELAVQFGASRVTIRKALDALQSEGLVVREHGRGTFTRSERASRPVSADVTGLLENLLALGLRTHVRVLEFGYVPAPEAVAEVLRVAPGTILQRAVRLRRYRQRPFSLATTWVIERVGRNWTRADMAKTRLLTLLDQAGVVVVSANQRITATAADVAAASLLGVAVGAPLLRISRVVTDQHAEAVEYIQAQYRPDLYAGYWQSVEAPGKPPPER
jgi:GntR family transcriptional regulator